MREARERVRARAHQMSRDVSTDEEKELGDGEKIEEGSGGHSPLLLLPRPDRPLISPEPLGQKLLEIVDHQEQEVCLE